MKLITAHRILIGAGIGFFVFYAGWRLRRWGVDRAAAELAQAVVSAAIAVALIGYYRTLKRWGRR